MDEKKFSYSRRGKKSRMIRGIVLYAKRPFAGTEQLLGYVGHYAHRVRTEHPLRQSQALNLDFVPP
jgi:hypothetical protein